MLNFEASKRITVGVQPLYKVVEDHLRQKINVGELIAGDLIPSEPQLAEQLQVSPGTVKKAIENLVHERLLYRHQGKGTYVSHIDFNNSLFRFFSYGDSSGSPARIHKETPVREIRQGTAEACEQLGVAQDTRLLYIERLGYDDNGTPVLHEQCWWIAELVQGLEDASAHIPDLLYAAVVEQCGVPVVRSEETLTAQAADETLAERLSIPLKDPLVVLQRRTYTTNDRIIEFRIARGRADRFSYRAEIR